MTCWLYSNARNNATKWPIGVSRRLFQLTRVMIGSCSWTLHFNLKLEVSIDDQIKPSQILLNIGRIQLGLVTLVDRVAIVGPVNATQTSLLVVWQAPATEFDVAERNKVLDHLFEKTINAYSCDAKSKLAKVIQNVMFEKKIQKIPMEYVLDMFTTCAKCGYVCVCVFLLCVTSVFRL